MNLYTMQTALYQRLKFATPPSDSTVTTRLNTFLNESQREIVGMTGMGRLRREVLSFTCTANSPFAAMPASVERIITIQDRVNQIILDEVDIQDIRFDDPGLTATSTLPYEYAVYDYAAATATDPTTADKLFVKSDSASDGSSITAYIEGFVTGGYYQKASAVMNGTTAVQFGTLTTWTTITKFYISLTAGGTVTATGNITLNQTSGSGTELARLAPGYDYGRYVRIHLYPVPTQVNTYYADVELHIEDMANAGDEPYLPEDFHWILVSMALAKEYQYRENWTSYESELGRYRNGLGDLQLYLKRRGGVALGDRRRRPFSQLGPDFPAGT